MKFNLAQSFGGLISCSAERGLPEAIVLDNGPEFRDRALALSGSECFRHNPHGQYCDLEKLFKSTHTRLLGCRFRGFYCIDDYVSPFHPRSMNCHRQSGGHWNVALGLAVRRSDFLGSLGCWSRSGEGSVNGTLFFMPATLHLPFA